LLEAGSAFIGNEPLKSGIRKSVMAFSVRPRSITLHQLELMQLKLIVI